MGDNQAVLIFDGDCGFCTSAANFIRDKSATPIAIAPWQLTDVGLFGLTQAQTQARVYFVLNQKSFGGHKAFAKILQIQPNYLLKAVGSIIMVPPLSWLASPAYALVAKYRHKLPGGTPACKFEPGQKP